MIFCWCYAKCFRWRHQFSRNSFIFNFFSRLENLNHFANVLGEIDRAVVFIVFVIIGGISFSTFANQGSIHSTRCAFFGLFIFVQCTFSPAKWWFVSSSYSLTISLQWIEFNGIKYLYLFKKLLNYRLASFATGSYSCFEHKEIGFRNFECIETSLQLIATSQLIQFGENIRIHRTTADQIKRVHSLTWINLNVWMQFTHIDRSIVCFVQSTDLEQLHSSQIYRSTDCIRPVTPVGMSTDRPPQLSLSVDFGTKSWGGPSNWEYSRLANIQLVLGFPICQYHWNFFKTMHSL